MARNSDVQDYFNRTLEANFVEFSRSHVASQFKKLVDGTLQITANLKSADRQVVEDLFPVPITWQAPSKPVVQPHAVLAAVRDGLRKLLYSDLKATSHVKTLFLGSTYREIANGINNSAWNFSIYGKEPKDEGRIYSYMLEKVTEAVQLTARFYPDELPEDIEFKATNDQVIDLYAEMYDARDNVGVRLENSGRSYERLVMEDSHYNYSWEDYYSLFERTGANSCSVLGLLPPELVCNEVPQHGLYSYSEQTGVFGTQARLCDSNGYAHGYSHDKTKWATLLSAPAYSGKSFNLVAEVKARVGPMYIIEITRTRNGGVIPRELTLLDDVYVKVLNLRKSYDKTWAERKLLDGVFVKENYFLVKKTEYDILYEYVASLDRKSPDLEVVMSTIRKRSGGAALIDKVFTRAWELESDFYMSLAATVIVKVAIDQAITDEVMVAALASRDGQFVNPLFRLASFLALPLSKLVDLFSVGKLRDKLVLPHFPVLKQEVVLKDHRGYAAHSLFLSLRNREGWSAPSSSCNFCETFPWLSASCKDDKQEMVCSGVSERVHEFSLTDDEVARFRETLVPADDDPPSLAAVKEQCKKVCPKLGFSFKTTYRVMEGAFGTGKSFQVKKVVKSTDAVIAPFRELMADYDKTVTGDKILFKTNHRVVSLDQVENLFVDEAFSMPYEFLALAVWRSQPKVVYLVGDVKQCKTRVSEGLPIDSRMDVSKAHTLVYNFRNSTGTVAWANETFGYKLKCAGPEFNVEGPAYEIVDEILETGVKMSPERALVEDQVADLTVRSAQGKTYPSAQVLIRPTTLELFSIPCIKLVAATRSRSPVKLVLLNGCSRDLLERTMRTVEYLPEVRPRIGKGGAKALAGLKAIRKLVSMRHAQQIAALCEETPELAEEVVCSSAVEPHSCRFRFCQGLKCLRRPLTRPSERLDILKTFDARRAFLSHRRLNAPIVTRYTQTVQSPSNLKFLWAKAYLAARLVGCFEKVALRAKIVSRALSEDSFQVNPKLPGPLESGLSEFVRSLRFTEASRSCSLPAPVFSFSGETSAINDEPVEVVTTRTDPVKPVAKAMQATWEAKAQTFVTEVNTVVTSQTRPVAVSALAKFRSGKDSYRHLPDLDSLKFLHGSAFNRFTRMPSTRFTGRLVGNFTQVVNSRGNERKQPFVYKMGTSTALQFDSCNQAQGLQSLATRYAVPKKQFLLTEEGRSLAKEIARAGFEACIDRERLFAAWNDVAESDVYQGWLSKAKSAGYAAAFNGDETSDRVLRFHPKASQKIKQLKWDTYFKCPQGISETSKGANTLFGAACRFVSKVILAALKPEYTWNNGLTPQQAASRFSAAAMKVPVKEGVTLDVEEMDSMQNEFTHCVNWEFDLLLGCSDEFISLYYSLYKSYLLVSDMALVDLEWVKPSGAPWTLKGNTFLEFLLQNYIIEGEGPLAVFMQGDDLDRRQAGLHVNHDRLANVGRFCGFKMMASYSTVPEFCGYVMYSGVLVPSVRRKLCKLVAAPMRGSKHFYEYAVGLRDWVSTLRSDPAFSDILRVNAEQNSVPFSVVLDWFEVIESACHCSWEQWSSASQRVPVDVMFLDGRGYANSVW